MAYTRGEPVKVRVHYVRVPESIDVKSIRVNLDMTQQKFARQFGFSIRALRRWECGDRRPKGAAHAFLTVIARHPDAVMNALTTAP